jgi:hypothetical protein
MHDESQNSPDALQRVLRYHENTKHHFQRYASGPGSLDWATQADPFRRYAGARLVPLEKIPTTDEPLYDVGDLRLERARGRQAIWALRVNLRSCARYALTPSVRSPCPRLPIAPPADSVHGENGEGLGGSAIHGSSRGASAVVPSVSAS